MQHTLFKAALLASAGLCLATSAFAADLAAPPAAAPQTDTTKVYAGFNLG